MYDTVKSDISDWRMTSNTAITLSRFKYPSGKLKYNSFTYRIIRCEVES